MIEPVTQDDLEIICVQLQRQPRGVIGVAARCVSGHPAVIVTEPRLPDGQPFPTFFYLTCPGAVAAVSSVEAAGRMREAEALLSSPGMAAAYREAHFAYLRERDSVEVVAEISGVSAGGMPTRVKCLHALCGHALAMPGVNPIGDWGLRVMREEGLWSPESCGWTCSFEGLGSGAGGLV